MNDSFDSPVDKAYDAGMDLDAQISDNLAALRTAIEENRADEIEFCIGEIMRLSDQILEVGQHYDEEAWEDYALRVQEIVEELRQAIDDENVDEAEELMIQIHELSMYDFSDVEM